MLVPVLSVLITFGFLLYWLLHVVDGLH